MDKRILTIIYVILFIAAAGYVGYSFFNWNKGNIAVRTNFPERPADPELAKIYDRASDGYDKIMDGKAKEFQEYIDTGFDLKALGDATKDESYYSIGAGVYEKASAVYGDKSPSLWLNWGSFLALAKSHEMAEAKYKKGIELFPKDEDLYLGLAHFYEVIKKPDAQVVKVYEQVLDMQGTDKGKILINYAAYLKRAGNYESALHYYTQLSKAYPDEEFFKNEIRDLQSKLKK